MAGIARMGDMSVGADGGAPTALTAKIQAVKTYINGSLIGLVGDQFAPHTVGSTTHQTTQRQITSGSTTMFFEGHAVARGGDPIADGDIIDASSVSTDSYAGG